MIIEVVGCWNWVKGIIHLGTGNIKLQNYTKKCYKVMWTVFSITKVLQSHVTVF